MVEERQGERKELFRQLLSSHAMQVTFTMGQAVQPQLHALTLTLPSAHRDAELNNPNTDAVDRTHLSKLEAL